jgi:hypothetical protein
MPNKMKDENLNIQSEFERLMRKDPEGLLKPEALVEAAENPTHPLHDRFEWDDTEAARLYRVNEARTIIRSFKISVPPLNVEVQALSSLDIDRKGQGGYRWTLEILERPDLREQLVETALKELTSLKIKYEHLKELSSIWKAIDKRAK